MPEFSYMDYVKFMHNRFGITAKDVKFTPDEKIFRIIAMQEELDEYKEAETPEDELDALVDLVVFALGTAERQGWSDVFGVAFERVMNANMQKMLGGNEKRNDFELDLVKPEGWQAPDLTDLIEEAQSDEAA